MTFPYTQKIYGSFDVLSTEAQDLYLRTDVPVIRKPISALEFQRDWVAPNLPVLFKGAVNDWPAVKKWTTQFFRDSLGLKEVTIAVTPNGYADAVAVQHYFNYNGEMETEEFFTLPEERTMPMQRFMNILDQEERCPGVFYLQQQNSNLTKHFPELLEDISSDIPWASDALNGKPEAINLWIGESRAVTSMHKDPYENIYCVVSGHKDFILHPPTDRPWIPYKRFPVGIYNETLPGKFEILPHYDPASESVPTTSVEDSDVCNICNIGNVKSDNTSLVDFVKYVNTLDIGDTIKSQMKDLVDQYVMQSKSNCSLQESESSASGQEVAQEGYRGNRKEHFNSTVPWICIDPLNPDFETYPLYRKATPVRVRVSAGDALYLPALWFHHVQQSHGCIAVNYWYDMRYDIKYAYFQMLESLANMDEV